MRVCASPVVLTQVLPLTTARSSQWPWSGARCRLLNTNQTPPGTEAGQHTAVRLTSSLSPAQFTGLTNHRELNNGELLITYCTRRNKTATCLSSNGGSSTSENLSCTQTHTTHKSLQNPINATVRQAGCFSKSTKCLQTADLLRILGFHVGQRTPGGVPQSPAWTGSISLIKLKKNPNTFVFWKTCPLLSKYHIMELWACAVQDCTVDIISCWRRGHQRAAPPAR